MSLSLTDVLAAQKTISGQVVRTPLIPSPFLSARAGAPFLLKMETMQPTGAFKLRGGDQCHIECAGGNEFGHLLLHRKPWAWGRLRRAATRH